MIDSHTHLFDKRFTQPEKTEPALTPAHLLANAAAAGVKTVVTIATTPDKWPEALHLAESPAGQGPVKVYVAAGLHPGHVANEGEGADVTEAQLTALAQNPRVAALGETGLDYHYTQDAQIHAIQQEAFRRHLRAAQATGLPVVIHTRDAEADTLAILAEFPTVPFVLHCFTGSAHMAQQAIAMGGYISFSGVLTFKNSQPLRDIAATLPQNRILIETDAPYLAPEPHRGGRNQPAYLPHTAAVLAACRSQSVAEIIEITTQNTRTLFSRLQ